MGGWLCYFLVSPHLLLYIMKEKTRVALSITLWISILLGFVGAGIYGITTIDSTAEVAQQETIIAQEVLESKAPDHGIATTTPDIVGLDSTRLNYIAKVVEEHIARSTTPGAVVTIVRGDKIAYCEAFGSRAVEDATPMSIETPFDLASLTKPIVTATAVLQLVERGELRLGERVSNTIPDFEGWHDKQRNKRHDIRIIDLLTHTSALPPYISLERLAKEYPEVDTLCVEHLMDYIAHCDRELPKDEGASRYSCLNYITLGRIVEAISGISLDEYAMQNIILPLGMLNTTYNPNEAYAALCAPTSPHTSEVERCGIVDDPLAREIMGGISGNAGLFSTAQDLATYAAMMLNNGSWNGTQILSPLSIDALFNIPYGLEASHRTLGWRAAREVYDAAGDLLIGEQTIVHTGATGTSMVIDRCHDMAIIILTNRTNGTGTHSDILDLRSKICNIAAAAIQR